MTDKSYLFWNSLELIEAYRKKHLSPVEVVKNSIEQAHKIDEYVTFDQLKRCLKMLIDLKEQLTN